jgi:hypothetical protein
VQLGLPWTGGDLGWGTDVTGVAIDTDGRVVAGCDECIDGQSVLARFDAQTGELVTATALGPSGPSWYSAVVIGNGAAWVRTSDGEGAWRIDSSAAELMPIGYLPLSYGGGSVHFEDSTADALMWGDTMVDTSAWPSEFGPWQPLALVEPDTLVIGHASDVLDADYEWERGCLAVPCGLALVDRQGQRSWFRTTAPGRMMPQVRDGSLIYVDERRRLVATPAPVTGWTAGTWPMIGADPQNTNRAR